MTVLITLVVNFTIKLKHCTRFVPDIPILFCYFRYMAEYFIIDISFGIDFKVKIIVSKPQIETTKCV